MDKSRIEKLHELEEKLDYRFTDINLLNLAFFHSSYGNENKSYKDISNERLEFLGDSVLDLIVSDFLYNSKSSLKEGAMTKIRSQMVCEKSFSNMAKYLELGKYLMMGHGEFISGGSEKPSVLADTFEAVFGAIYLDSGYESAFKIVENKFKSLFIAEIETKSSFIDYKTMLQENNQKNSRDKLKYKIVKEEGPDHDKKFYVDVYEGNLVIGSGFGSSKKHAEQDAARNALIKLRVINE
ncbi:ribonuclease III [Finegoldia magna]|uniref:ribonuclease III n=1 Tax=Finegoldia TaxID=150022 RepID=UPI000B91B290|nr:ribonuclease III [Finegoldia magna]OXZ25615.1 ribonuclease III [Finegoldia magna]